MLQDALADVLNTMKSAEKIGKRECVTPASTLIKSVLQVMQDNQYIGAYEFVDNGKGGKFKIELKGNIIDCNVVKPRFSVDVEGYEKWEKRFLPARNIGVLIVSTSKGVMDHKRAKELHVGGKLLAFCY